VEGIQMKLSNSVAVVTGGASGLGFATVELFVASGAKVAIFDIDERAGNAAASAYPGKVIFCNVNVVDAVSAQSGINKILAAFNAIHIVVNCAGIVTAGKTLNRESKALPLSDFAKVIHINLIGTFNISSQAAQAMALNQPDEQGQRGIIINTCSVAAFEGQVGQVAYAASKGGVASMTLPMARDLARYGIRAMAIAPGVFDTPMMSEVSEQSSQPLLEMIQNPKRFGLPAEYAQLCVSIVENNYLNGEIIRIDGGLRMSPK
jgi:NAD(P)-dependent dehydrogenase (short-subunit alcohol dehydrogenase family)